MKNFNIAFVHVKAVNKLNTTPIPNVAAKPLTKPVPK